MRKVSKCFKVLQFADISTLFGVVYVITAIFSDTLKCHIQCLIRSVEESLATNMNIHSLEGRWKSAKSPSNEMSKGGMFTHKCLQYPHQISQTTCSSVFIHTQGFF